MEYVDLYLRADTEKELLDVFPLFMFDENDELKDAGHGWAIDWDILVIIKKPVFERVEERDEKGAPKIVVVEPGVHDERFHANFRYRSDLVDITIPDRFIVRPTVLSKSWSV